MDGSKLAPSLASEFFQIQMEGRAIGDPGLWSEAEIQLELASEACQRFCWFDAESPIPQMLAGFVLYRLTVDEIWIMQLAVRRKGQRRGAALMHAFHHHIKARDLGCEAIWLEVSARNLPAISLYQSSGFTEISQRKNYYRNGDDALLMKHLLD